MRLLMPLVLLAGFVSACSEPEPLQGVDLPPASLPDEYETAAWGIAFSHDFEAGYWNEGQHVYTLELSCPESGFDPLQTNALGFSVSADAGLIEGPVYIRLVGLSHGQTGPPSLVEINTEQPTTAVVTLLGLPLESVDAAGDCAGVMRFDGQGQVELLPGEPFRP